MMHQLKMSFEKKGHHVDVYAPGFSKWKEIDAKSDARNTVRIPIHDVRFFYNLEFSRKFQRLLKDKKYDIIFNTHAHLGCFIREHPNIIQVNCTSYGEAEAIKPDSFKKIVEIAARKSLGYLADRKAYSNSDHIICVNDHIRENLVENYNIPQAKIDMVGNGVDCDWFSPAPENDRGQTVITYVGRLVNRKNVALLIEAAALLDKENTPFNVRIIGEGEEEDKLKHLAASLGLGERIRFLGRKEGEDLRELYRTSSIFVLPSRYEGLPLSLLEAQACGLPAVVTAFSGAEKIVKDDENGYVAKGWEASDLAVCIKPLINNKKLRLSMSANARKLMVEEYSWDRIADKLLDVFEKVRRNAR